MMCMIPNDVTYLSVFIAKSCIYRQQEIVLVDNGIYEHHLNSILNKSRKEKCMLSKLRWTRFVYIGNSAKM